MKTPKSVEPKRRALKAEPSAQESAFVRDLKAQLYQGLAEIESLLPPGSQSHIEVNERNRKNPRAPKTFVVSIALQTSLGRFDARSSGTDAFEAMASAKSQVLKEIQGVYQRSQSTSERSFILDNLLRGPWLH